MGFTALDLPRLEDFDICPEFGFATSDGACLQSLHAYYKPWEDISSQLTTLLANKQLKKAVIALPQLGTDKLVSNAERQRAYLVLAFLTQAYAFGDPGHLESTIPSNISEPFLEICNYWGLQPILSSIGYCLWNWKFKDQIQANVINEKLDECKMRHLLLENDLENVELCSSFTSTEDEKAFTLVPLLVEAEGGCMVAALLNVLHKASIGDTNSVIATLMFCDERLTAMAQHLKLLHERCDPQSFYHRIRPFIAGSQGMESKGFPDGFVFELVNGQRVSSKCVGASAGQSSLFQFLDHMFGIKHESSFATEMRSYMPRKHREFLDEIEKLQSLREYIRLYPENQELAEIFERCVAHLRAWRAKHIGLATRYVVMPARKQAGQDGVKGTGGSLPIPFLKEMRNETV